MKTALAYILGFSLTFTVITGGMYFVSSKYPWMFKSDDSETNSGALKPTVAMPPGVAAAESPVQSGEAAKDSNETMNTLKTMLAEKNDSISIKDDSIQQLNSMVAQLQKKNSDANIVIAQLQTQVNSWNSQRRKDMASAYNDMDAASVAKIMTKLDDRDIIFILSSVQKKQAAKILGDLDPGRAARLMASLGQLK